jgi:hypothetical protein
MKRFDIINKIISDNGFKKYLEIGVRDPRDCFNLINCEHKDSVDPGVEILENLAKYQYTSDDFFHKLERGELDKDPNFKWDLVFIDGLHLSDQVFRDVINSLNHLNPKGYIILHDCNPPEIFYAREDALVNGKMDAWNGTVWKALYKFRTDPTLDVCTVDTDWGCGIIRFSDVNYARPKIELDNSFYEYNKMTEDRRRNLGLIRTDELNDWLEYRVRV